MAILKITWVLKTQMWHPALVQNIADGVGWRFVVKWLWCNGHVYREEIDVCFRIYNI